MKTLIILAFAFSSLSAFAGNGIERFPSIDFSRAEQMTERAQVKLEATITSHCTGSAATATGLSAEILELQTDRVDNGIIDVTYVVEVKFYGSTLSETRSAIVKLTDYAGSNPFVDWVTVHELSPSTQGLCN